MVSKLQSYSKNKTFINALLKWLGFIDNTFIGFDSLQELSKKKPLETLINLTKNPKLKKSLKKSKSPLKKLIEEFKEILKVEHKIELSNLLLCKISEIEEAKEIDIKILSIIQICLSLIIMTRPEDEYINLFHLIGEVEKLEEDVEDLNNFIRDIIEKIDEPHLNDSLTFHFGSSFVAPMDPLVKKLEQYEKEIERLGGKYEMVVEENKRIKNQVKNLINSNKELRDENEEFKIKYMENTDMKRMSFDNKFWNLKKEEEEKYNTLQKQYKELKMNRNLLKNKLAEALEEKEEMEEENKSHIETLSTIPGKFVKKQKYDKLSENFFKMERKFMQMENNYITEKSQVNFMEKQLKKLKSKYDEKKLEEESYKGKISDLRKKFKQRSKKTNDLNLKQSIMTQPPLLTPEDQNKITFQTKIDLSTDLNLEDSDLHSNSFLPITTTNSNNYEMYKVLETMQATIDNLKSQTNSQNKGLDLKFKNMKREIEDLKNKNKNYKNENQSLLKSRNDTSMYSRDSRMSRLSKYSRKNSGISEEYVDKAVKDENKIKKLRESYKLLNKEFIESRDFYSHQSSLLYSIILKFLSN